MSRDIFVQDIPAGIANVREIPDDWRPEPLRFAHADVLEAVRAIAPEGAVDMSDAEWLQVEFSGVDLEVDIPDSSPLRSFAIHDRSADAVAANTFVAALLSRLGARAFDPESSTGLFG